MATEFNDNNLVIKELTASNVLLSALTVTNNLSVSRTTSLSNVNVAGVFSFGQGTPALNVRNDGIVVVNTLSAATISATQIVGFETYDQSLNTTDVVAFQQVNVGTTEYREGAIATTYGRNIGFDDGAIDGQFYFGTAIDFQTPAIAAGTRDNLGLGTSNNVQFASVSASNIQLTNATLQPGQTLTSSVSSLIIRINGQQYRLPLLPV